MHESTQVSTLGLTQGLSQGKNSDFKFKIFFFKLLIKIDQNKTLGSHLNLFYDHNIRLKHFNLYFVLFFFFMSQSQAAPLHAIGDPIEWEERVLQPYFSPMTGRPWWSTQSKYLRSDVISMLESLYYKKEPIALIPLKVKCIYEAYQYANMHSRKQGRKYAF